MDTRAERVWTQEGRPALRRKGIGGERVAGPGPWWDEPDKVHWIDPVSDCDCLVVRNHFGAWCGYVAVPPGHPWHGVEYGEMEEVVRVHGGLTFADRCREDERGAGFGICHVPFPGRPHDVWWLGWDACHGGDLAPVLEADFDFDVPGFSDVYRDLDYARAQTEFLARQVAGAGR
jgi:hypothetical protein